jgi:hypothetical protein
VEPFVDETKSTRFESDYNPALQAIVTAEYDVTTYTERLRTCTNCSGQGVFASWALGS